MYNNLVGIFFLLKNEFEYKNRESHIYWLSLFLSSLYVLFLFFKSQLSILLCFLQSHSRHCRLLYRLTVHMHSVESLLLNDQWDTGYIVSFTSARSCQHIEVAAELFKARFSCSHNAVVPDIRIGVSIFSL